MLKKLACFYEPQFDRISRNISLLDSVLGTKKASGKSVKIDLPNSLSCSLWQIVSFDSLTFLTALVLFNNSDYLNHSNGDSNWLTVACFMRVQSMLTTLLSALKTKFFFIKLKVMLREFNGIFSIKQIEKPLTMLCSAVKQLGSG